MNIRVAREQDAAGVCEVFRASYGQDYCYPRFFETDVLRRMILGEDALLLVAEEPASGRIVATASVVLEIGAFTDLVGEFGRLVVLPDYRRRGIATLLMQARLERVRDRLHVGLVDARVVHTVSQVIAQRHGFAPVGFCPLKDAFRVRESAALLVQFFGDAIALRRNDPRIIPEIYPLASLALTHAGLPVDVIVDENAPAYPHDSGFRLERLTTDGYAPLLRIERGRVNRREVYGPVRLQYGFFKLRAAEAEYLLAKRGEQLAGAVGFVRHDPEKVAKIFELITPDDQAVQYLLAEVERRCREDWGTVYLEIDVRADAPRLQRTLLELGFVPASYCPAMVFDAVERHDVVKMIRVFAPLDLGVYELTPEMQAIADVVIAPLREQQIVQRVGPALRRSGLFAGLTDEQLARVASIGSVERFATHDTILREGATGRALYVVLSGTVDIELDERGAIGRVGAGEALGEMGLLAATPHAATAVAADPVEAVRIGHADLAALFRRRPDLGSAIYHNLACGLGRKLERADRLPQD